MANNTSTNRPSLTTNLAARYEASADSTAPKTVAGFTANVEQGSTALTSMASAYAPTSADLVPYTQADAIAGT